MTSPDDLSTPGAAPVSGTWTERGDEWFHALFDEHATAVFRYFRRRLPSAAGDAGHDAEDLTADVLATAWRRRADVPDPALPWLYRTAAFVLANHRRKARPIPVEELPDVLVAGDIALEVVADDEVRRVLSELTDRDRSILALHAWEGLAGNELATTLGISRGGADAALSRARSRLRAAWADTSGRKAPDRASPRAPGT